MKRHWLPVLLGFSLLLNIGVLGAVGYQAWAGGDSASNEHDHLVKHLKLSEEQRTQWRKKEEIFLRDMGDYWAEVRFHRERMIREIFAQQPDPAAIEASRAAICRLQENQQRQVIKQLMEEKQMLTATQREALAELLVEQKPAGSLEERLHGN
ncbi:MAG: periplasmic heavy metal sensor [Thiobacillus sp.]|jgi:Spy/CpxP family protein refolding chaperone|uniref:periplasmic heavy metal sensor n=1 Tax=Thiobacillus sp. TaxID=924 RepID=UPI002894C999|nr:periplasmic heavy metal sensor [Thiobacillus sp.]MDT3705307.1 periplasmic heavy metal sensor [Thiobacillus sp.]